MAEELEKKIEEVLFGKCPSCEKKTELRYADVWSKGEEMIKIYVCSQCRSTVSLETFYAFNPSYKPTELSP